MQVLINYPALQVDFKAYRLFQVHLSLSGLKVGLVEDKYLYVLDL